MADCLRKDPWTNTLGLEKLGSRRVGPNIDTIRGDASMTAIRDALNEFLAETGEGNRRSMSSPCMVMDLFGKYFDEATFPA